MSGSKKQKQKKVTTDTTPAAKPNRAAVVTKSRSALFLAIILFATIVVYVPSLSNLWTNWDDEGYVLKNNLVTHFDLPGIVTEQVMGNYHPVTVFVQAVEYYFFKEDAAGFHIISLLLHLLNAALLFYFVLRLTGSEIAALICALLFGIHPMHVESVSWVSAQKDLLYTFFYFAALVVYVQYKQSDTQRIFKYGLLLLLFALALLSKAQAVTLPVVMLLIDWYQHKNFSRKILFEKIPFFALSFIFGLLAIYAQKASESIQDIALYSFPERLMFSAYAIVGYITRLVLPVNLSAYYPYPEERNHAFSWLVYASPVMVLLLGGLVFWLRKKYHWLVFGMVFFLINIFLVLQLLPVGGAITADRYTYLSFTGFFFAIGMLVAVVWEGKAGNVGVYKMPFTMAVVCWILFLCYQCKERTGVWYSSEKLWTDVMTKFPRVPIAYNDLGSFYQKKEMYDLAKKNFNYALYLQPDFSQALINRCDLFRVLGKIDSAIIDGNHAVKLKPNDPDARMNRGIAFSIAEKNDSAMVDFMLAISQDPLNARAYNNLGNLYMIKDQPDAALINYNLALKYDPKFLDVLNNRGLAFLKTGNYQQAVIDLSLAISNMPNNANNYYFRMQAFEKLQRYREAVADAQQVQKMGIRLPEGYVKQLMDQEAGVH